MIKRSVIAVMSAVLLVALTVGGALADHPANDGQRFSDQPPEVQALYAAVHGANADAQWVIDHNAAIGQPTPAPSGPTAVDRSSDDWLRVNHVAWHRSGDLELAARIADSVIMRGTVEEFLAGTDMGVLYGYVPPAAPAPRAPSGGGGGGGGGGGTPSGDGGAPAPAPAAPAVFTWASPQNQIWFVGEVVDLTLPVAPGADDTTTYALTGTIPDGLSFDADARKLGGLTTAAAPSATLTLTATTSSVNQVNTLEFDVVVYDADTSPMFAADYSIDDITLDVDATATSGLAQTAFADVASGGNGTITYSLSPDVGWVSFDASSKVLTVTVTSAQSATFTYTATDHDGDSDSVTFMVTVRPAVEDVDPTFGTTTIEDVTLLQVTGVHRMTLPEATGGNGDLTYTLAPTSGTAAWVTFNAATREATISRTGPQTATEFTYTATDEDGNNPATLTFEITIEEDTTPTLSQADIATGTLTVGVPVSVQLAEATGGNAPLEYSVQNLPDGMSFNSANRYLGGTPTTAGTTTVTYTVTDNDGDSVSDTFDITIDAAGG
ncbi:MAG: putative Ig domain-containing protein [Chloroflexi bacterium]|nr:putative Ig domain-containing protein [Chloroflexota bacterium]MCY3938257.1 putative Ig domain-containing protein [Chloroflexota bacterium]